MAFDQQDGQEKDSLPNAIITQFIMLSLLMPGLSNLEVTTFLRMFKRLSPPGYTSLSVL